jgi:hypothetical protein
MDNPEAEPYRPKNVSLYRNLIYGFAKAFAVVSDGVKDTVGPTPPEKKLRPSDPAKPRPYDVSAGGVILPTGAGRGRG